MWLYISGALSFAFLIFASWCVGEGGEILGSKYDASVIGGLVIAWLNTAPEAIFFVSALSSENPRFAIGAVSGSTIVVCTVALGACLYIGSQARKGAKIVLQPSVKTQCYILMASIFIPLYTMWAGFSFAIAILGVLYYCGFLYYSLTAAGDPPHEDHHTDLEASFGDDHDEEEEHGSTAKGIGYLVLGGALIIFFSTPFIDAVVLGAELWHVSPTLLAFFLAPVASEAPEILESISLARKGNLQNINIAVSNLIGGTITKTTLLVGIFSFFGIAHEFKWESPNYETSLFLLTLSAAFAGGIGALVRIQGKEHGLALFAVFLFTAVIQYEYNSEFPQVASLGMSNP